MSDLKRTQEIWRGCDPKAMSVMSPAAIFYALTDAKHDIVKLHSELAALREELAGANRRLGACINQIEEQQQRLAAAEQRNAELRQELATLHAVKESPGENVLWDVLNATVGIITRRAYPHALESEAHNAGAKVILDRRAGLAATHLKPTESGASE